MNKLVVTLFLSPAILFSSVTLSEGGAVLSGIGSAAGIIMEPEPGTPENYNILSHECGHYAGYNCGNQVPEKGGRAHNKDPKNIMFPDDPPDPIAQRPDKCWCEKMAAVAKAQGAAK